MRKRVSLLLASTTTVVGLAAGVTPAQAAPKPEADIGRVYIFANFGGSSVTMESQAYCEEISFPIAGPALSARNTSTSSTVTLYADTLFGFCIEPVVVLRPGERDTGYRPGTNQRSKLGSTGAYYYSSS